MEKYHWTAKHGDILPPFFPVVAKFIHLFQSNNHAHFNSKTEFEFEFIVNSKENDAGLATYFNFGEVFPPCVYMFSKFPPKLKQKNDTGKTKFIHFGPVETTCQN